MSVKLRTPYVLTLREDGSPPDADSVRLYARDVGGVVQLFASDADGNESQVTGGSGGLQLTATDPVVVDAGIAALGVSPDAAKGDHKHSVSTGTPTGLTVGGASAPGGSVALARADHVHALPQYGTPVTLAAGGSNLPGSVDNFSRSDHIHALPAYGTSAGTIAQGNDARLSNDRTASGLRTATTTVTVSTAAAPSSGQVLTALGPTGASWQTPTGGGGGGSSFLNYPFDLTRGNTDQAFPDQIASTLFNSSGLTGVVRFVAVLECTTSGQTASLELYNISDGATVDTISTTNTIATRVTTDVLSLPGGEKLYGVRLTRTGGTSADRVTCKLARFENTAV